MPVHASPPPNPAGTVYSSSCLSLQLARKGLLVGTYSGAVAAEERVLLEGVLPAGARRARLTSLGGRHTALIVHDGVYAVSDRSPSSVSFRLRGAGHTVAIPLAPGSGAAVLKFVR